MKNEKGHHQQIRGICTRRTFLLGSAGAMAIIGMTGCARETIPDSIKPLKSRHPKTALVLWYSQAGHTERNGRLIGKVLEKAGLTVAGLDIRQCNPSTMKDYDLIIMGTPVYYLDTPGNVRSWLASIPSIDGIPTAAFATFGGPGDNQYNTAFSTLQLLTRKGGVPVGIATFGNMSTFAPTWSYGNEARILRYKDRPNEEIYTQVREFAKQVLRTVQGGGAVSPISKEFHYGDVFKGSIMMKVTKLLISSHTIDANKCIGCGTCVRKCPVGATHPEQHKVDQDRCIACMGCVNNCPAQAIDMVFFGKKVYGFKEFLRKNNITIQEPKELQG
jgi:ferredoxin/flavodoxin